MFNDARYEVKATAILQLSKVNLPITKQHQYLSLDKALKIIKQFKRNNADLCDVMITDTNTGEVIYHYKGEKSNEVGFANIVHCYDRISDHVSERLTEEYYEDNFDL